MLATVRVNEGIGEGAGEEAGVLATVCIGWLGGGFVGVCDIFTLGVFNRVLSENPLLAGLLTGGSGGIVGVGFCCRWFLAQSTQ